jgi:predicted site-specific integrase-resolvase
MHHPLSPAETARLFGISIKALRVYEQHGLPKPSRTTTGKLHSELSPVCSFEAGTKCK